MRTRDALREQLDASLAAKVRALAQLVEYDDADGLETDLSPDAVPGDYVALWNDKGELVIKSRALEAVNITRSPRTGTSLSYRDVQLGLGTKARQVQLVFPPRQEHDEEEVHAERPLVTLALATPTAAIDESIATIRSIVLGVGALATLIALALLVWLIRVALRPVHDVAAAIAAIDANNLAASALPAVPAELAPIRERLADLLTRLERAFARERELTAEVAHELRTPLTGLRSTIEVALGKERTPERYRDTLSECLAICAQTERTVEMLLALARLDGGATKHATEAFSLDGVVRDSAARIANIETTLVPTLVRVDREQLRVVVDNLLDNAAAYRDAGTTIRVEVGAELTVTNACSGITAEQAAHVFERFWRADKARTIGHAGLGLALCKKLVELAGGTISATARDGQFSVRVVYPRP